MPYVIRYIVQILTRWLPTAKIFLVIFSTAFWIQPPVFTAFSLHPDPQLLPQGLDLLKPFLKSILVPSTTAHSYNMVFIITSKPRCCRSYYYTVSQKNILDVFSYNSRKHWQIFYNIWQKCYQGSYYFAEFIFSNFSLTFPDKMNNFPWLISLFATPVKQY